MFRQMFSACLLGLTFTGVCVGDDWPQWMGPERDGIWRETGIIDEFPASGPKILWRTPISGGYSGPAVVGDRVYVTDKMHHEGGQDPSDPFSREAAPVSERILCLNRQDGAVVWKHEYPCEYTVSYPAGPRTTPLVADGYVYTLGAEGDLHCLNAETGDVIWHHQFKKEFDVDPSPVWGWASNPLLDGDRLICFVGGENTAVVAFHKLTGEVIWSSLSATGPHGAGYSSPVIVEAAGTRQLIVFTPEKVHGISPEDGTPFWDIDFPVDQGVSCVTPQYADGKIFISAFYGGSLLLKLDQDQPGARVLWHRVGKNERDTDALHCMFASPVIAGDTIFGADSYGEFRALDLATGDRLWMTYAPTSGVRARWGSVFIIPHEDEYVLFSEKGDLIFADLDREGYHEISRAHILEPTAPSQRREVVWTFPAFSHRCAFIRNDREIVCVSLAAEGEE